MLSLTTTIETGFGSRVVADGFLLNNELTDFAFAPEADGKPVANRVEPGKRPRSSMAPTIVLRGRRADAADRLARRRQHHPLRRRRRWSASSTSARTRRPRSTRRTSLNRNGPTQVEAGPEAEATIAALAALGHAAEAADLNSGLHAILIRDGTLVGAADKRREGLVMGE